jgi:thioredoxin-dependent peroxiredoxin
MGVRTFGISLDSVATQAQFVKKQELNFQLLSDPDGSAGRKYQALPEGAKYPKRVTFVIDPKGKLRLIDRSVSVRSHGDDLAQKIDELQGN